MSEPSPSGYGTPFSVLLVILSLVVIAISIGLFLFGWHWYASSSFVDHTNNLLGPSDVKWLVVLFSIPVLLQVAGLFAMFPRVHRDKSLVTPYGMCVFIMSLCPLSYCLFWAFYTYGSYSDETFSSWALGCVVILLVPVALMTYAIMWTGKHVPRTRREVRQDDIQDLNSFCSSLRDHGNALGGYRRRLLDALPAHLSAQIRTARSGNFDNISKDSLLRYINKALEREDLHLAVNLDDQIGDEAKKLLAHSRESLSREELQRLNYLLLKVSCRGVDIDAINSLPAKKWSKWSSIRDGWENFLQNIKTGAVKAHFWVFANFFAVFLGITYLFGFAFAFHDQKAISDHKEPALYMAKPGPSNTGAQELKTRNNETRQAGIERYTFYFDSISAHPNFNINDFNLSFYKRTKDDVAKRNRDWKENTNYKRFTWLSEDVNKLTANGKAVRIELQGYADDSQLKDDKTYASNYELSEARAQNLKRILLTSLAGEDSTKRSIEMITFAISSEDPPLPPLSKEQADERDREKSRQGTKSRSLNISIINDVENRIDDEMKRLIEKKDLSKENAEGIRSKVSSLKAIVREKGLTWAETTDPREKIFTTAEAMSDLGKSGLADDEKDKLKNVLNRRTEELQRTLDGFEYVDKADSKRIVMVSLVPVENYRGFVPLSLLDYMYFTIYTITTTGYGDIVPTTPYAKFLCSFANILEVFFLVVFFNALLSVRAARIRRS